MRSFTRVLALAITLTTLSSSLPAFAASSGATQLRDRDGSIVVIVRRAIKRFFGITNDDGITIPKPDTTAIGGR